MPLSDREWKNLGRDLQQQRCVLFLGSRLMLAAGSGAPLEEQLAGHLADVLEQEQVEYEKRASKRLPYLAQRFLTIPKIRRIDLEDEVLDFYKKQQPEIPALYHQLAKLPFTLIINTAPDDFMLRALHQAGKTNATSIHYNLHREREAILPGSIDPEHPLVYNLWGALQDPESLVLESGRPGGVYQERSKRKSGDPQPGYELF